MNIGARGNVIWAEIARILEGDILSGACLPGERMPTEAELALRFRVNRHTVRRAMAALRDKRLVRVEQGRGTFVQESVIPYAVTRRTRFSENILLQKRSPGGLLLHSEETTADGDISQGLHIPPDRPVLRLDILREADGRPLALSSHYFPLPRFSGMVEAFLAAGSVTVSLRAYGVTSYRRVQTNLSSRLPSREEARLLEQPRTAPVIIARSVNVDERGIPIDYGVARYSGARVEFVFHTG